MKLSKDIPSGAGLYGATFDCTCGRTHTIEPREMIVADYALDRLPDACARALSADGGHGTRAAVLMDARTREVAGSEAADRLRQAGWTVAEHVVADPRPGASPVCDDITKEALDAEIGEVDVFVAVGSGVLNDLAKWLSFGRGVPYVVFATAASMTGYTSANVAPAVAGVKTLVRAAPPAAVLSSLPVLCGAPYELTASGFGDAVAKIVSSADWRMNALLFGDFYCPQAVALVADVEPLYLDRPEAVRSRDRAAMAALFEALNLTGVSMTMAGTSSPASGGEHLVSHALDMMSSLGGRAHDLHGRQVGVGTVLAAAVYERVLALESPDLAVPSGGVDRAFWGRLADEVAGHYAEKRPRLESAAAQLFQGDAWDRLRAELAPMVRSPGAVRDCLARAGAAVTASDIGCNRARLLAAFGHAHEMRARFTVLDLAHLVGVMPVAAEGIVDAWAV